MIAISVAESKIDKILEKAELAKKAGADLVEIRLDCLERFDELKKLADIELPIISVCRPSWEFGKYRRSEYDRLEILKEAIPESDFVEIESDSGKKEEILKTAEKNDTVTIVSKYYESVPIEPITGGDFTKIVVKAKNMKDNLSILKILESKKNLIAYCWGKYGRISRILAQKFGSYIAYCCLDEPVEEGQIDIKTFRKAWKKIEKRKIKLELPEILKIEREIGLLRTVNYKI